MHRRDIRFSTNDGGGGAGGAAEAATGIGGDGRGGGRLAGLFLFLLFTVVLAFSFLRRARPGQGELLRAAGGLREAAADGEQEKTVYTIVMMQ